MQSHNERQSDKRQQIENAIQQAQFEAAPAPIRRRRSGQSPRLPVSWSGVGTRSWLDCADLEMQLDNLSQTEQTPALSAEDRARLMTLGKDLAKAWNSPGV